MKRPGLIAVALLILALFALVQFCFLVREGQVAVLTRLGKPVDAMTEAGLYPRMPWPIERVYRFDHRVHTLETSYEETLTEDGKYVLVGLFCAWRIAELITFLESVGNEAQAEINLDGLVRAAKSAVLGKNPFSALVNVDPEELGFDAMEDEILAGVKTAALERYGLEVMSVGMHRLGLPAGITESVFARMRAERQKLSDRYKSEGEGEAIRIRAQADSEGEQLLSKARADAKRIRAEADAAALEIFKVFEEDPELAIFLRDLEVMEESLKERSTGVFSTESEPFHLFNGIPSRDGQ